MTPKDPVISYLNQRLEPCPFLGELWALYIYNEKGALLGLIYDESRQVLAAKLEDVARLLPALNFTSRIVAYHVNTDEGVQ